MFTSTGTFTFLSQGKNSVNMGQSFHVGTQIFPSSLFFINPTFCIGSGERLFQGRLCEYAMVINEATYEHNGNTNDPHLSSIRLKANHELAQ